MNNGSTALHLKNFNVLVLRFPRINFLSYRVLNKQREKPALHFLLLGYRGNALQERLIAPGTHSISKNVDHQGPARPFRMIGIRAVDQQGMMERGVSFFQLNRDGMESRPLFRCQELQKALHVAGKLRFGE